MSDQKHTPLPWKHRPEPYDDWGLIRGADGFSVASTNMGVRVPDDGPHKTWTSCGYPEPAEIAANAALIVRAVNAHEALVEAVEAALDLFQKMYDFKWAGPQLIDAVEQQLRAALALARD